jgi:hypothetical protein
LQENRGNLVPGTDQKTSLDYIEIRVGDGTFWTLAPGAVSQHRGPVPPFLVCSTLRERASLGVWGAQLPNGRKNFWGRVKQLLKKTEAQLENAKKSLKHAEEVLDKIVF